VRVQVPVGPLAGDERRADVGVERARVVEVPRVDAGVQDADRNALPLRGDVPGLRSSDLLHIPLELAEEGGAPLVGLAIEALHSMDALGPRRKPIDLPVLDDGFDVRPVPELGRGGIAQAANLQRADLGVRTLDPAAESRRVGAERLRRDARLALLHQYDVPVSTSCRAHGRRCLRSWIRRYRFVVTPGNRERDAGKAHHT
jgi:hypothetical protein